MIRTLGDVPRELACEHLRKGRILRAVTSGYSMWPTLKDGDLVEVLPSDGQDIALGDVVLMDTPRGLVLHRVVKLAPGRFESKGDASRRSDGAMSREHVVGKLARRRRDRLMARCERPLGLLFSLGAGVSRRFFDQG